MEKQPTPARKQEAERLLRRNAQVAAVAAVLHPFVKGDTVYDAARAVLAIPALASAGADAIEALRKQRDAECERANKFAEFIRSDYAVLEKWREFDDTPPATTPAEAGDVALVDAVEQAAADVQFYADDDFEDDDLDAAKLRLASARTALLHRLATTSGVGVPDGWQVAPKEPTEAMNKAGGSSLISWVSPAMHADDAYRAMLAAAPLPPTAAETGEQK